jgi:hypothetical protein
VMIETRASRTQRIRSRRTAVEIVILSRKISLSC